MPRPAIKREGGKAGRAMGPTWEGFLTFGFFAKPGARGAAWRAGREHACPCSRAEPAPGSPRRLSASAGRVPCHLGHCPRTRALCAPRRAVMVLAGSLPNPTFPPLHLAVCGEASGHAGPGRWRMPPRCHHLSQPSSLPACLPREQARCLGQGTPGCDRVPTNPLLQVVSPSAALSPPPPGCPLWWHYACPQPIAAIAWLPAGSPSLLMPGDRERRRDLGTPGTRTPSHPPVPAVPAQPSPAPAPVGGEGPLILWPWGMQHRETSRGRHGSGRRWDEEEVAVVLGLWWGWSGRGEARDGASAPSGHFCSHPANKDSSANERWQLQTCL